MAYHKSKDDLPVGNLRRLRQAADGLLLLMLLLLLKLLLLLVATVGLASGCQLEGVAVTATS